MGKIFRRSKTRTVCGNRRDYWQNGDRSIVSVRFISYQRRPAPSCSAIERLTQTPNLHIHARSDNFLPGGFFEIFLRETFNRQYPILEKVVVSGHMAFQLQAQGSLNALTAAGEVTLKNGDVRAKSKDWQISAVTLNLPFQVSFAGAKAAGKPTGQAGMLLVQSARFGSQTLPPVSAAVSLFNNTLKVTQPVRLAVFGGTIEINNLLWPNIIINPKELSFSASASRLQLVDLTRALAWPALSETLTRRFRRCIRLKNSCAPPENSRRPFRRAFEIAKLEVEEPFSTLASIKLDTKIRSINSNKHPKL